MSIFVNHKLHHLGQLFGVGLCLFSVLDGHLDCKAISESGVVRFCIDLTNTFGEHRNWCSGTHSVKDR
jgi:hypothetical protein